MHDFDWGFTIGFRAQVSLLIVLTSILITKTSTITLQIFDSS
jgi:hypothetical protein